MSMNWNVLLSSLVLSLSILMFNVSYLLNLGLVNIVIAMLLVIVIELTLGRNKRYRVNALMVFKHDFINNLIYVLVGVTLLIVLVCLFSLINENLRLINMGNMNILVLLLMFYVLGIMSFGLDKDIVIHIGRIVGYLVVVFMLVVLINGEIDIKNIEININEISLNKILSILPFLLNHLLLMIYLRFDYTKEIVIGNGIGCLFVVYLIILINSINLPNDIHLLSVLTLIECFSLISRLDVFLVSVMLVVEGYRICLINNILSIICMSENAKLAMKFLIGAVIVVGLFSNLQLGLFMSILGFSGIITMILASII